MLELSEQELQTEAQALARNKLLPMILARRQNDLFEAWKIAHDLQKREVLWIAFRESDSLAGAIENAIREHGGSRNDSER